MTKVAAGVLRSAMLGANAMHKKGWLHGDLKPANIGLIGLPQRAILLDIGHAAQLRLGSTLDPTPGRGGTLGYIAPEREMERYGHAVDVWSLGIIGFELTYGFHPWRFAQNPWRNDWREGKDLRLRFDKAYEDAIEMLTRDASEPEPSNQHIQREFVGNRLE
jgi:serine/threonine protein kinase